MFLTILAAVILFVFIGGVFSILMDSLIGGFPLVTITILVVWAFSHLMAPQVSSNGKYKTKGL